MVIETCRGHAALVAEARQRARAHACGAVRWACAGIILGVWLGLAAQNVTVLLGFLP